jgi:hypothetical protein
MSTAPASSKAPGVEKKAAKPTPQKAETQEEPALEVEEKLSAAELAFLEERERALKGKK